jgi:hypothetical protein
MYLIILFLSLISAAAAGLFGRFLGSQGAGLFTTTCIMITSLFS